MRTTIDLPDPLFREVKATAAARGLKLKEFITSALRDALRTHPDHAPDDLGLLEPHRRRLREHFLRMDEGRDRHDPVSQLDRESLHGRHA